MKNISQIKEFTYELENIINKLLKRFKEDTGLYIEEIKIINEWTKGNLPIFVNGHIPRPPEHIYKVKAIPENPLII